VILISSFNRVCQAPRGIWNRDDATGIPVATVAIDGAENAAILAAQIIALWHYGIRNKIKDHRSQLAKRLQKKSWALKEK